MIYETKYDDSRVFIINIFYFLMTDEDKVNNITVAIKNVIKKSLAVDGKS